MLAYCFATMATVRGITGNAMERARAAMDKLKAEREANRIATETRRKERLAERKAAGLSRTGRPRVHGRTKASQRKAKAAAKRAADRAAKIERGEIVPRKKRSSTRTDLVGLSENRSKVMLRQFRESIPADQWQRVLEAQPTDSPGGRLLSVMSDVRMGGWSLERQCAEAGLKIQDLVRMISDHSLGSALVASTRHVHEVVEGVAESAKSRMLVCELCLGLRDSEDEPTYIVVAHPRIPDQTLKVECPKCGGVGRVRKEGSPRAVETFLKLHGGLEEQQGPTVNVNTQVNFGSQHSMGVQRGQQLLEQGRLRRSANGNSPIVVTATPIESPNGASE